MVVFNTFYRPIKSLLFPPRERLYFCLSVILFAVRQQNYLQSNERICIKNFYQCASGQFNLKCETHQRERERNIERDNYQRRRILISKTHQRGADRFCM